MATTADAEDSRQTGKGSGLTAATFAPSLTWPLPAFLSPAWPEHGSGSPNALEWEVLSPSGFQATEPPLNPGTCSPQRGHRAHSSSHKPSPAKDSGSAVTLLFTVLPSVTHAGSLKTSTAVFFRSILAEHVHPFFLLHYCRVEETGEPRQGMQLHQRSGVRRSFSKTCGV